MKIMGKRVPSRTVSSVSDADERNVGRSAEGVYAEERAAWNADCLEDERRGGASVGRERRAERARKVGEHSRAANVEECLCRGFRSRRRSANTSLCERV